MKATSVIENILLILFGCLAQSLILAAIQTCRIRLNPDLNDHITQSWLMEDFMLRNSSAKLECASRCLQEKSCVTFMVDRTRKRCRLYAARITRYNTLVDAVGFRSYDTCRGGVLGEVCSTDDDCAMLFSVCAGDTCQCDYGWSYSPNDLACVKDCVQYGTEFTYFTETFLSLHHHYIS
ncbi:unnamed protein product [Candidula unifasciata]|uniref:Apple domain-containing protein n=1 Tax=Candidula unifasciata TaxID=100452 RepID=A0A8S3YHC7_9EUPU|nr:unnamed protein product [Candidula unifasciata]